MSRASNPHTAVEPAPAWVRATDFVAPGTNARIVFASIVLGFAVLMTLLFTWGIALLFWIIGLVMYVLRVNKAKAALRGSALQVGPNQFPGLFAASEALSQRLGLPTAPEVYIVDSTQPNASAFMIGSRQIVILHDEIIYGARDQKDGKLLEWILAHELAHHALGHTSLLRSFLASRYSALSRRDEFSCDAVATALVGDVDAGVRALTLLLVGSKLYADVNPQALNEQVMMVISDKNSRKSESHLRMTHPLLLRRIARLKHPIKL